MHLHEIAEWRGLAASPRCPPGAEPEQCEAARYAATGRGSICDSFGGRACFGTRRGLCVAAVEGRRHVGGGGHDAGTGRRERPPLASCDDFCVSGGGSCLSAHASKAQRGRGIGEEPLDQCQHDEHSTIGCGERAPLLVCKCSLGGGEGTSAAVAAATEHPEAEPAERRRGWVGTRSLFGLRAPPAPPRWRSAAELVPEDRTLARLLPLPADEFFRTYYGQRVLLPRRGRRVDPSSVWSPEDLPAALGAMLEEGLLDKIKPHEGHAPGGTPAPHYDLGATSGASLLGGRLELRANVSVGEAADEFERRLRGGDPAAPEPAGRAPCRGRPTLGAPLHRHLLHHRARACVGEAPAAQVARQRLFQRESPS